LFCFVLFCFVLFCFVLFHQHTPFQHSLKLCAAICNVIEVATSRTVQLIELRFALLSADDVRLTYTNSPLTRHSTLT
jgi:hypothetical protein